MMNNNQLVKMTLAAVLSLSSLSALAQVTLNVGENTIVTAINGQEVKNGLFSEPQRKFSLEPGRHVITAKYTRLFDLNSDNHDILRSSNISIPVELIDNQTYTLVMAGQPQAYQQVKDYIKKPTLAVIQGSTTIASQQGSEASGGGIFSGLGNALGGVFGGNSNAIQSNQQTISALEGKPANVVPAISQASVNNSTLDQFMQLWLKATPAEREKIRQWVQQ